jgi:uncharacterized phage protein gp47/JayE
MRKPSIQARDAATIRNDMLRGLKYALERRGIVNPNVGPDSDFYVEFTAIANELVVVEANSLISAEQNMPDTAADDGIERWGEILKLQKREAVGSVGSVLVKATAASLVATGAGLKDKLGQRYKVVAGGTFADGASVSVAAVDVGAKTNLASGEQLAWSATPPYFDGKTTVDSNGFVNGADAEGDEELRARVLDHLRTPPRSGNWQHVVEIAEASSPTVQKAFCYPAPQGAGTYHVAVTARTTATNKERDVELPLMTSTVVPYVIGSMPEHTAAVVTTVDNAWTDVAFGLTLPEPPTGSPSGPGGGWLDAYAWPKHEATIALIVNPQRIRISSSVFANPISGVTRISCLSPVDWKVYTAKILTVAGPSGYWDVTLDSPLPNCPLGTYVWPACEQGQKYADAVINYFAAMGPGEKTANASLLTRSFRHPVPQQSWNYRVDANMLRAISNTGPEVLGTEFFSRVAYGSPQIIGSVGALTPSLPVLVNGLPKQFIPRNIAFYKAE